MPADRPRTSTPPTSERAGPAMLWFTGPVIAIGFAVIGMAFYQAPQTPHTVGWLSLGILAAIAATFALRIPGVDAHLSISDTFFFTSVLMFGPAPATVMIALDSFVMSWRRGHSVQQMLFNPACSAIALWVGAESFYYLAATPPLAQVSTLPALRIVGPLACLSAVHFILNFGLTSVAIALQKRVSILQIWRHHVAMMSLSYFAAGSAAFFLVVLWEFAGILAIVAALPLLGICYVAMRSWLGRLDDAREHLSSINKLYLSTISAFSTAIEAKDGVTSDHIHRVHGYALALARAMNITDTSTMQAIEAAALLHDTGKLAVPEHILNKPGVLTAAEFETMKLHVDVGADILSSIDFPYPVVPIVRAHHENWDGSGYPAGLRGEQIPIGARIVSVVDCYDALTSDRPYRAARTQDEALQYILDNRGTKYDPAVVDAFVRVVKDIAPTAAQRPELLKAITSIKRAHSTHALPNAATPRYGAGTPVAAELGGFVSLARVATGKATVSDVGTLAWEQLRHLFPDATLALYTIDAASGTLNAAFTAGSSAQILAGHSMCVGERVSGWSAANSQTMRNAEASLDLPPERRAEGLRFALALPLVPGAVPIGVLTLYAPHAFSDECMRSMGLVMPPLTALLQTAFDGGDKRQEGARHHAGQRSYREPLSARQMDYRGRPLGRDVDREHRSLAHQSPRDSQSELLEKVQYAALLRDPRR